jgi:hypothetical protein
MFFFYKLNGKYLFCTERQRIMGFFILTFWSHNYQSIEKTLPCTCDIQTIPLPPVLLAFEWNVSSIELSQKVLKTHFGQNMIIV